MKSFPSLSSVLTLAFLCFFVVETSSFGRIYEMDKDIFPDFFGYYHVPANNQFLVKLDGEKTYRNGLLMSSEIWISGALRDNYVITDCHPDAVTEEEASQPLPPGATTRTTHHRFLLDIGSPLPNGHDTGEMTFDKVSDPNQWVIEDSRAVMVKAIP